MPDGGNTLFFLESNCKSRTAVPSLLMFWPCIVDEGQRCHRERRPRAVVANSPGSLVAGAENGEQQGGSTAAGIKKVRTAWMLSCLCWFNADLTIFFSFATEEPCSCTRFADGKLRTGFFFPAGRHLRSSSVLDAQRIQWRMEPCVSKPNRAPCASPLLQLSPGRTNINDAAASSWANSLGRRDKVADNVFRIEWKWGTRQE